MTQTRRWTRLRGIAVSAVGGVSLVIALAGLLSAPASSATSRATKVSHVARAASAVVISTRTLTSLGTVLVNGQGHTLYMFVPDKQKKVTCVRGCAVAWPPVKIAAGVKATAKGSAEAKLLSSDADPAGGRVVTYNGWPLYTWAGDRAAGQATGQALNANGGLWYVLSPTGQVIKTKVSAPKTGGGGTTSKGGGNAAGIAEGKAEGCPAGTTISQSAQNDQDADNFAASGADDFDGCL